MSVVALYETAREIVQTIYTKDEKEIKNRLPQHLALVFDKDTNEEMVYYVVYAEDWHKARHKARHTARQHFEDNFPLSSKDCDWRVDSVEIN